MTLDSLDSKKQILTSRDADLLRESVWHAVQRGDISDEDRKGLQDLYERLNGWLVLPRREVITNPTEELHFHLVRAERHAQSALDLLYKPKGLRVERSFWFHRALGKAQSILMTLYVRDINRKKKA